MLLAEVVELAHARGLFGRNRMGLVGQPSILNHVIISCKGIRRFFVISDEEVLMLATAM